MARMSISRTGLELIESFEGFRARAARLPDGRYTIGFGHTQFGREGIVIDRLEAEDLLRWDLRPVEDEVRRAVHAPMTQNQFDALVSLAFNIGTDNFLKSDVLRHMNAGEPIAAATAMGAWRCALLNGRMTIVDALVRRRAVEAALFLEPDGNRPPAPTPVVVPTNDNTARLVAANDTVAVFDPNTLLDREPVPARTVAETVATPVITSPLPAPEAPAPAGEPADATEGVETALPVVDETPDAAGQPESDSGQEDTQMFAEGARDRVNAALQPFPARDQLQFEEPPPAAANRTTQITSFPANDALGPPPFGRRKGPAPLTEAPRSPPQPAPPSPDAPIQPVTVGGATGLADSEDRIDPWRMLNLFLIGLGAVGMITGLWRAASDGLLNRPAGSPPLDALQSIPLLATAVGFVVLVIGLLGVASSRKD